MADQPNVIVDPAAPAAPKDLLSELVGEGKKYKSPEDLARSRLEADKHIAKLEMENREMREKLVGAKSVQDVLEAVKASAASANDIPDPNDKPASAPGVTAEQVAKMVADTMTGLRTKEARETNLNASNRKMFELFGDKAQEIYLKEASTPELQRVFKELAETDPEKFIAVFQKPQPQGNQVDNKGKNTAALNLNAPNGVQPGTQAWYSKLRKENPKAYYSADVQLKMHNDALADPAKYFGRT